MLSLTITGIPDMQNQLKNTVNNEDIKKVLIRRGLLIEGDAKQICTDLGAVDTGRLRGSISTNWDGGPSYGNVESPASTDDGATRPMKMPGDLAMVHIGSNVEYAPFVHEGTRRMQARPFMDMALMRNIEAIQQDIEEYFNWKAGK